MGHICPDFFLIRKYLHESLLSVFDKIRLLQKKLLILPMRKTKVCKGAKG